MVNQYAPSMLNRLGEFHNVERLEVGSGSLISNVFPGWSVLSHLAPGNSHSNITFRITARRSLLLRCIRANADDVVAGLRRVRIFFERVESNSQED